MKRLGGYGRGEATCNADGSMLGPAAQQSRRTLHSNLAQLVNQMLAPLLDRVSGRGMETYKMHDRKHGLKVAHLMWHILTHARRKRLTAGNRAVGELCVFAR